MNAPLQTLLDRQAITELLYRYCRACDRADEVLLRSCFHPYSTHRHGAFEGLSTDFCGFAMKIIGRARVTKHVLTNVSIELDGDRAWTESHYSAYHRLIRRDDGTEEDNFSGGRYLDYFERNGGPWRIAARIGLIDHERFQSPTDRNLASLPDAARSRRLNDDPLYTVLGPGRARRPT